MKTCQVNIPPEQVQHMLDHLVALLEQVEPNLSDRETRFDLVRAENALRHLQSQLEPGPAYVDPADVVLDWLHAVQPPAHQFVDDAADTAALGTALRIYASDHGSFMEKLLDQTDWVYVALQYRDHLMQDA